MSEKRGTILIIGNNPARLKQLENALKDLYCSVLCSENIVEARKIFSVESVNLILCDLEEQLDEAIAFCDYLKRGAKYADLPIVFAVRCEEVEGIILKLGTMGIDFITKPFCFEELKVRVNTQMSLHLARKTLRDKLHDIKQFVNVGEKLHHDLMHDIRSPFATISMMMSLIEEGYMEPNTEELNQLLQETGDSLSRSFYKIENTLDLFHARMLALESTAAPVVIDTILQKAASIARAQANFKGVEIINKSSGSEILVLVDSNMLSSVFRYVISNSIKNSIPNSMVLISSSHTEDTLSIKIEYKGAMFDRGVLQIISGDNSLEFNEDFSPKCVNLQVVIDYLRQINGTVSIETTEDTVTVVTIALPIYKLNYQMGAQSLN